MLLYLVIVKSTFCYNIVTVTKLKHPRRNCIVYSISTEINLHISGAARVGHTGACALATRGCPPPVQVSMRIIGTDNIVVDFYSCANRALDSLEIQRPSIAMYIHWITSLVRPLYTSDVHYTTTWSQNRHGRLYNFLGAACPRPPKCFCSLRRNAVYPCCALATAMSPRLASIPRHLHPEERRGLGMRLTLAWNLVQPLGSRGCTMFHASYEPLASLGYRIMHVIMYAPLPPVGAIVLKGIWPIKRSLAEVYGMFPRI